MPLKTTFTIETPDFSPQSEIVMPRDFVFRQSYTDCGPEVIAFRCHPSDAYSELHIIEGIEDAEPEDKILIGSMLGRDTFVSRVDQPGEKPEQLGYWIVNRSGILGWFAVQHMPSIQA